MTFNEQQIIVIVAVALTILAFLTFIQVIMYLRIKKKQNILLEKDWAASSNRDNLRLNERVRGMEEKLTMLDDSVATITFQIDEMSKRIEQEFVKLNQSVDFKQALKQSSVNVSEGNINSESVILNPKDVLKNLTISEVESEFKPEVELGMNKDTIFSVYGSKNDFEEKTIEVKKVELSEEEIIENYFKHLDNFSEKIDQTLTKEMNQNELAKTMNMSKSELEFVRSFNKLRGGE